MKDTQKNIIIIGAGASGFFAAIHNKQQYPDQTVILIEKSQNVLSKVKISGGGRCNVTHACFDPARLCGYYPRGQKALRGAFHRFQPEDTIKWFESHGVKLKVESDNRVFPVSDKSQSIIDCLVKVAKQSGVKIWTGCDVRHVSKQDGLFHVELGNGQSHVSHRLILATGSSRVGYQWAGSLGHTLIEPVPSLFTFKVNDKALLERQGVTIKEVELGLKGFKKKRYRGPVLITHWGVSGPGVIQCSAWHARDLHQSQYTSTLALCWLPDRDAMTCKRHCVAFGQENPNKKLSSQSPFNEIPTRFWQYLVEKSQIEAGRTWHQVSEKEMGALVGSLISDVLKISGKGQFKEEFVTCGGVKLDEIEFKNMSSKVCPGLHIVGELLDIDGITGGFNFQNAWTTGYLSSL